MTNETLSPTSGSVGGGSRSSNVFTTAPEPPTGYPVVKSRGPASLIPNPRCDVPPPAYSLSGSGIGLHVAFVFCKAPAQFDTPIDPGVLLFTLPKVFSNP